MGAISRTFTIPFAQISKTSTGSRHAALCPAEEAMGEGEGECFQLTLHEPALTADNLGMKTWASSYLLAKRLVVLRKSLPALQPHDRVLELGAGTGLVGMAAAVILEAHVYLTDLPEIVPNLEHNVRANVGVLSSAGGEAHNIRAEAAVLDWSEPQSFSPGSEEGTCSPQSFPLILAADPIYSPEHPRLLVNAISCHLSRSEHARVVIELPLREAYVTEREDLRERMSEVGLVVVEQGEEVGYDDWADGRDEEELAEVRCWWSVWGWRRS